jgi:hypothetical protein
LVAAVRRGSLPTLTVQTIDGAPALGGTLSPILEKAGFSATPRGLRCRA